MKKTSTLIIAIILLAGILLSSCSSAPADPTEAEAIPPAAETEEGTPAEVTEAPTDEPVAAQATTSEETQEAAEAMEEPEPIMHQSIPGEPVYTQSLPGECNTGFNYGSPGYAVKAPCDSWSINLLERPVSADLTAFYHYLDILDAKAGAGSDWLFFQIDLFGAGTPEDDAQVVYYIELDKNQDGQGDFLIAVTNQDLYNTEWSVAGVQVFEDQNEDVGGATLIRPDATSDGDGYDALLFDAGAGDDPDLAWARRDSGHVNQVEFAVKSSLLGGSRSFMWWAGAIQGDFSPQAFDLVDSFTSDELYPIDTTCGWIMGQEMTYNIRKCYIAPEPTARPSTSSQPAEEVCVQPPHPDPENNCWIWFEDQCEWVCFN